ncbi:MAG: hypothetical protein WA058_02075 [Minisyncoccia bacterium]
MATRYALAMSRFVSDQNGRAIEGATVTVYAWNGSDWTLATIYDAYTGGSVIAGSVVTTDAEGAYLFFVSDSDYPLTTSFKLVVSKENYDTKILEHVR